MYFSRLTIYKKTKRSNNGDENEIPLGYEQLENNLNKNVIFNVSRVRLVIDVHKFASGTHRCN